NKLIRYASEKQVEAELLIHFCSELNSSGIPFRKSPAMFKLFLAQLKKTRTAIETMHEDLQYDYLRQLEKIPDN
ncbi:MAG: hypothetical protein H0U44_06150, partial [Flavisolibacter sp.]|nr:hypothetical protein [Flavisolibacter sp.]